MKKYLLIMSALLLTAVGASAQTAYKFVCTDWGSMDLGRVTDDNVTPNETNNTISVVASGTNNVALSNGREAPFTTANYTVTKDQCWFVVVGTNISTASGDSKLWWMDGANWGEWDPTEVITLSDGQVLVAWDLSTMTEIDVNLQDDVNYLDGWTGFGLTSTTGTSVISNICFYTLEEAIEAYPELDGVLQHDAIPYEFYAEDWVSLDLGRVTADGITYNSDNTITVAVTGNQNVALGNSYTQTNTAATIGTNGYYITSDQTCFVIVGTGLSTASGAYSDLWWLNGVNANVTASTPISLSDGQTLFYWDFSNTTSVISKFEDGKMVIDGWTGGGLTATGTTATISYIGFCTKDELTSSFTIPENTYVHACTANRNVWTVSPDTYTDWVWLDTSDKNDESGMTPPCLSYWTSEAEGATLPSATITHDALTGLAAGVYEVSMDIRIIDYDEGQTVGEGTLFKATAGTTTVSQDIELGVDAHDGSYTENGEHEDLYGTYTLYVTVAEGESLTVSLEIPENATYNWISFKNLTVKSLGTNATPVTVSGEMQADYGTLILPFAAEVPSDITAYTCDALDEEGTAVSLTEVEEGGLKAGTPYIIGGSANTSYNFSGVPTVYNASYTSGMLTGTLVDMSQDDFTADGTEYVLQNHTEGENPEGIAFYPITSSSTGVSLTANHCYLTLGSGSSGVRAFIGLPGSDNEETAIEAVESDVTAADAIYDLSGRRVSKAVKGVYIQNGKKVLVK